MWESGSTGGVVAVTRVLTQPGIVQEEDWELEFHVHPGSKKLYPHVRLQVVRVFPRAISRLAIAVTPGLENLMILRFGQKANYPVTDEEARCLERLIEVEGWEIEPPAVGHLGIQHV